MERCFGERYTSTVSDGGNVFKKKLIIAAVAATALFGTAVTATAADSPGLVPKKVWDAKVSTIKIGLEAPMTGVFAVLGISQRNSLQVVADQINAAGGIGGAKIELVVRDDALNPVTAANNAKELAGDSSINMVVGPSVSSFYSAAAGYYEAAKKLNCQPAVAALDFTDYKYAFRSQDYYKDTLTALMTVLQKKSIKKFGMIYEAGATGEDFNNYYTAQASKYGLTYLGWQKITSTATSHNAELQKLIDLGAEAVSISNNAYGAYSAKAAKELKYKGILMGGSGAQNIAFHETGGDDFAGTLMAAPNYQWPLRDKTLWQPGYKAHTEAVVAKNGFATGAKSGATSPNGTAIAADCLYSYAVAANKVRSLDATKVRDAMEKLDIPAKMTPSGVHIHPGTEHNLYQADGINVYEWRKDAKGWYTIEVNGISRQAAACPEVGWFAKTATGSPLVCAKVSGKLVYRAGA
jgi:branched-chain amino acid transport system substrate-binding protein